jgi:hypothetical protein
MQDQDCRIPGPAASGRTVFQRCVSIITLHSARVGSGTARLLGRIAEDERRLAEYRAEFLREVRARLYEDHLKRGFTPKEPRPALPSSRVSPGAGRPRQARRMRSISRSPAAAVSDEPAPEPNQFRKFDPLDFTPESLIQIARYRGWHLCLRAHGYIGYDDGVRLGLSGRSNYTKTISERCSKRAFKRWRNDVATRRDSASPRRIRPVGGTSTHYC